eukprot:COSAG05_NODE_94_length_19565_cov_15.870133_1_plen_82_part_00
MKRAPFRSECSDLLPGIMQALDAVEASPAELLTGKLMASLCGKVSAMERRLDRMEFKHEDTSEAKRKDVLEVYTTRLRNKR